MNLKDYAIETLEIAEWNVLKAIFRLHTMDFERSILPGYNTIRWIIGHLSKQMDYIFNFLCQGEKMINDVKFDTLSIKELVDLFLQISKSSFEYLNVLPEEKFYELPEHNTKNTETISELIQRVALHFLGHVGQIIWIKKSLGKSGAFVMGVKKELRDDSRTKWNTWWEENKEKYASK